MKQLFRVVHDEMDNSLELFMMTYMDLNHVAAIHRGLNSWVDTRRATFEFQDNSSFQLAPFNDYAPKQGAYKPYFDEWMKYAGSAPSFGAKWSAVYPYDMVEEYPGILVDSSIEMKDELCINTLRFYATTPSMALTEAAISAYIETAEEDKVATENLEFDRRHNRRGAGTFHPLLPSGVQHWLKWMANRPPLGGSNEVAATTP